MDDVIRQALDQGHVIDITTTGRTSGEPRRIEIVFHNFGGRIYISGVPQPRPRAWIENLRADPAMTVHLKGVVQADLPATARVIDDIAERERILPLVAAVWNRTDIERMVDWSPLIEVKVAGYGDISPA